ncbi:MULTISPECIES: hypothetical protein [unclassified Streptococcus]|uniref:hypothetical protein n=1 Tax=unclassified Streptococcus TaxID=2608887 RepID=UPI0018C90132|nr:MULTISPECIES: hypothetical protein [unclassified Streptococcus]MBG9367670.1 hypothetical protein [Streptococcus sp. NLN64]MBJ6745251.1 hypothetical protein [Streptococcus sp. 121]
MKKLAKITLLSTALLTILIGCSNKSSEKTTTTSETVKTTQSSEEKPETVSFFADGVYKVGTDIKPGRYYVVLTEIQSNNSEAYISFYYGTDVNNYKDYEHESLKIVGKPYKLDLQEGMELKFESVYEISSWNVSFFTDEDYKEYQSSEKK